MLIGGKEQGEGYDWVAKQIKREAKKKNTKLFKIKQAPLPKTMTA